MKKHIHYILFGFYVPLCSFQTDMNFGELQEPAPITFRFETIGWKISAVLLAIVIISILILWIRKRIKNKYRRVALKRMQQLPADQQNIEAWLITIKTMAINVFGRDKIAPLYGKDWLSFLDKTGKDVSFLKYERPISASIYEGQSPNVETTKAVIQNAKQWIKTHAS